MGGAKSKMHLFMKFCFWDPPNPADAHMMLGWVSENPARDGGVGIGGWGWGVGGPLVVVVVVVAAVVV